MNKIVFFRYIPLSEKVKKDFLMVELSHAGYLIEYWDITSLYIYRFADVEKHIPPKDDNITVFEIHSKQELKYHISQNQAALFISLMTFEWKLIDIFHYFKKYHCSTAVFSYWPLPLLEGKNINQIKAILCDHNRIKNVFCNKVLLPFLIRLGYIKTYDYCFKAGLQGWKGIGNLTKKQLRNTLFFEINNWDYDRFVCANLEVKKDPYIVFLDEYFPFHPDTLIYGGTTVSPDKYYADMNRVFSMIEVNYGMPVVIAAHPKALKYKEYNYFNGRSVQFDSTLNLVSKASLVLAHDSLSIGFAIMCMKPLVFIDSDEIRDKLPDNSRTINYFSNFFMSPIINASSPSVKNLSNQPELSEESRKIYIEMKEGYMSTIRNRKSNSELLNSYLKIIFNPQ